MKTKKVKRPYWKKLRFSCEFWLYTKPSDGYGCQVWELYWVKHDGAGKSYYWCLEFNEGLYRYEISTIPFDKPVLAKRWAGKIIRTLHPQYWGEA